MRGLKDDALKAVTDYIYAEASAKTGVLPLVHLPIALFDSNAKIIALVDGALKDELAQSTVCN